MLTVDRRSVQNFDWTLVGLVAVLATFGLVNLVSATAAGVEGGMSDIVRRQMAAMALGAGFVVVAAFVDYRHVERFAPVLFAGTLALLALTLIVGSVTRGAQAWLYQGSFQPSELAKIGLVIMLARWLHRNPPSTVTQLRQLFVPLVITALPVGLILLQRDMGVALLTLLVALTYLPLCHIPMRAWWGMAFLAAGALTLLWKFGLKVYQQQRILDFMDPSRDPLSSGYQAMQSRIAVGSGGLFGTGWQEGTQTQLRFLPTQHTDFVFSVLAEEWGLIGTTLVLIFYFAMLLWGLWIARNSKDGFGAMLAVGLVGTLFWPAAINIAMVLGLAPVIGVPLPLFSYGGSALLSASIALGLLLNVSMRRYVF
ncbi:MAG: rod shape-determining protein RodA [Deltaproteobacteria bacterium]|nr:rod shape-determining protein RodA [Deltaproteobacteria bacterium]MBW2694876.1 rod shape-determining protein RodA [Deltaproteobacteria bacterium]